VQVFNAHGHLAHACDLLRNLPRNAMDGAVLRYVSDPEFLNAVYELQRVNYPVVLVDRPGEMNMPWVGSDCYTGSYQCAEALFEMGHRRVAYIGPLRSPSSRACLSGLRDAMNDKGVVWPLEMICDLSETTTPLGDWTDAIEQSLRKLLACTPRPTTVVFSGDKAAAIAYQLLRKMGLRVPDDLSIVGNGDMDIAQLINPPLSTLRQPFYEAGYEAMRMLLERLEQPDKQLESVQLSTQWVERESVARLV
jgi:LacI family transcriptional regulator